jgi:hypothetical protein
MNATPELPDLDERGRAAGRDLHTRATRRPTPAFDPDRAVSVPLTSTGPSRAHRRPLLAVAAAAVVVALVGVGVWAGTRSDDTADVTDQVVEGSIQPYLLDDVPAGLVLGAAVETDGSTDPEASTYETVGSMSTFGPAIDDPRVGLYVSAYPQFRASQTSDPGDGSGVRLLDELVVGDRVGYLYQASFMPGLLLEVPLTDAPDGPALELIGRDDGSGSIGAVMAKIAAATTVDGLEATVSTLPVEGWRLLDQDPEGIMMLSPMAALRDHAQTRSASAFYTDPDMARTVSVAVLARPPASVHTPRLILDEVETTSVRGHEAVVGRLALPGDDPATGIEQWSVRWMERPGEMVTVAGLGLDRAEVLAAAESITPVDPAQWEELLEATALGDLVASFDETPGLELGRGRFEDGTAWVLRYRPPTTDEDGTHSEQLDLVVALPGSSNSSFSSVGTAIDESGTPIGAPAEVFRSTTTLEKGGRAFAAGLLRDDVARVELRNEAGAVVGQAEVVVAEDLVAWVAELSGETAVAVAFTADGEEAGTTDIARYHDGEMSTGPSPTTIVANPEPDPAN